jgi:flagellar secretion chaperone FliS
MARAPRREWFATQVKTRSADTLVTMPNSTLSIARQTGAVAAADQASFWLRLQFDDVLTVLGEATAVAEHSASAQLVIRVRQAAGSIRALQYALDLTRGGELARNLFELFDYLQRQLHRVEHAEAADPRQALREVTDLLSQVMEAWQCEPRLIPTRVSAAPAFLH